MSFKEPVRYTNILSSRNLSCIKRSTGGYKTAPVLIAISHRNQPELLVRALSSAFNQTLVEKKMAQIVILDDQSDCPWLGDLEEILGHPSITILKANCGSPARSRNTVLDWADSQEGITWVARLDADDEFFCSKSLEALYEGATSGQHIAAIGSNALRSSDGIILGENIASSNILLNPDRLAAFVEAFCNGDQEQELPSCNLLLKTHTHLRYPGIRSAEDHWLLLRILLLHSDQVSVVANPLYSIYSLGGHTTAVNRGEGTWKNSRKKLAWVADKVRQAQVQKYQLLGFGMEGVVFRESKNTIKEFFPWAMNDQEALRLQQVLGSGELPIPSGVWKKTGSDWSYISKDCYEQSPGQFIDEVKIISFLKSLYLNRVVTLNIKRANLMYSQTGELHYIDVGKDIQTLTTSYFLDMSARLYAIGILGYSDEEMVRRKSNKRPDDAMNEIPGFSNFYYDLLKLLHPTGSEIHGIQKPLDSTADVTLLIKACAQDAEGFYQQVEHIVTQLSYPKRFKRISLLVDDYPGPFLRQYAEPNLDSLLSQANKLKSDEIIDEILIAPNFKISIQENYLRWFGSGEVENTHTVKNAPLYPQTWAFSHIKTRYVLQCDCDVLVGRKDFEHNYLEDMLRAIHSQSVLGVGFNIPKSTNQFLDYHGAPGQFAPEVRFGLLDLVKIDQLLPINNPIEEGQFQLTWHRALQHHQRDSQIYTSVRGGNPASFYIHPCNSDKAVLSNGVVRDLVSQGLYPDAQKEQFDLVADASWHYPERDESIVFLLKGRRTAPEKFRRCIESLKKQVNQEFGLIVIDDAGGFSNSWDYPKQLSFFNDRFTLIRNDSHKGYIRNFITAVTEVCSNSNSLIVVLDQDDFLMQEDIVEQLKSARSEGHDLIQMPMFRPNKPIKLYKPIYEDSRQKGGGNTWSHLRAFTKQLFDKIPKDYLQKKDGDWFSSVTDYATMLPLSELAEKPVFLDSGYAYWHERQEYSKEAKNEQRLLLSEIIAKPSLKMKDEVAVAPAPSGDECLS